MAETVQIHFTLEGKGLRTQNTLVMNEKLARPHDVQTINNVPWVCWDLCHAHLLAQSPTNHVSQSNNWYSLRMRGVVEGPHNPMVTALGSCVVEWPRPSSCLCWGGLVTSSKADKETATQPIPWKEQLGNMQDVGWLYLALMTNN